MIDSKRRAEIIEQLDDIIEDMQYARVKLHEPRLMDPYDLENTIDTLAFGILRLAEIGRELLDLS